MDPFEAVYDVGTRDSGGVMVLDCRTPVRWGSAKVERVIHRLDL
jgi:hypothetical protein